MKTYRQRATEIREALKSVAITTGEVDTLAQAASHYADLLETGPDYLAGAKAWVSREGDKWLDHPPGARAVLLDVVAEIVDAALASSIGSEP